MGEAEEDEVDVEKDEEKGEDKDADEEGRRGRTNMRMKRRTSGMRRRRGTMR